MLFSVMAGLREKKKEQTRARIAEVALGLFAERGYDAVTVNEIAEAAGVAKATLFSYFPGKECLALDGVKEDMAGIVARRPAGQSPLRALREHYLALATGGIAALDVETLLARVGVIAGSPALLAALHHTYAEERHELAAALTGDGTGDAIAALLAAQVTAAVTTLQERFFQRLVAGASLADAARHLAGEAEAAFDLLEHGSAHVRKGHTP
jgi:AcrR family transcriptional regulator